jgi:hypothetical protein
MRRELIFEGERSYFEGKERKTKRKKYLCFRDQI